MSNELRDPHDPVIPGEYVHPPEGHGGVTMPIGQSAGDIDPHEPVLPEGMMLVPIPQVLIQHVEDAPTQAQVEAPLDEQLASEEIPPSKELPE